jgi:arsenate reductase
MSNQPLVLAYAGCSTCKKALRWLAVRGVGVEVRPIVEAPPTAAELAAWIPKSGKPIRKWLNTSGQSYRALGKEKIAAATDAELLRWLTKDGKLVKRPVLVTSKHVVVGFDEDAYEAALGAADASRAPRAVRR